MKTFIKNRWVDAKEELGKQDPAFIRSVEAYRILIEDQKLILPQKILLPGQPLSPRWHRLLETTLEIMQDLQRLDLTVSLITPSTGKKIIHYYFDMWIQTANNLCYKVNVLVTHCCRLYLRNKGKEKYHQQIDSKGVQGEISALRHPLVHGEGDKGTLAKRVITEEHQGWEFNVAIGIGVIDFMLDDVSEQEPGLTASDWHQILKKNTEVLLANLGNVMSQLEQEISNSRVLTGTSSN